MMSCWNYFSTSLSSLLSKPEGYTYHCSEYSSINSFTVFMLSNLPHLSITRLHVQSQGINDDPIPR